MNPEGNLNSLIQGLRSRSGLPANCMKTAKIEWPRPLAIGHLAKVSIVNAPPARQARGQRAGLNEKSVAARRLREPDQKPYAKSAGRP
jgi:hypothetical protein